MSKKAAKKAAAKAAKEAKKAANAAARGQKQGGAAEEEDDPLKANYGKLPLMNSSVKTGRTWTNVCDVGSSMAGTRVLVRARVHAVRGKGKSAFLVLRQRTATVQAVMFADGEHISKPMVKFASNLTKESVVDVSAEVVKPDSPVTGCSQSDVELNVRTIHLVSAADPNLPFLMEDACRSDTLLNEEGSQYVRVGQDTRLDNRVLDLRTPANMAIFTVQSGVCALFREILMSKGFQEIHTPKLIGGTSEGGANVFRIDYFDRKGCLAQSPQLYKQMAICGDFERVFEIAPVFRAENSFTHRHMCEFTGLDFEMMIHEHYHEVLDVISDLFIYMFDGLNARYAKELAVINEQHPFEPLEYLRPTLRLTFKEGCDMLKEHGVDQDPHGDLDTPTEKLLGKLVKEKYKTDFYILEKYPASVRPFYTMPCPEDKNLSNSFDVFIRGEEIISGAQRIHDTELLRKRAVECGMEVEGIQSYIDSFKYGAVPHGGCGVGMERVIMLFCALGNIRKSSMFPRDPKRLTP